MKPAFGEASGRLALMYSIASVGVEKVIDCFANKYAGKGPMISRKQRGGGEGSHRT